MPAHPHLSPWPARLTYAAALLAVVWFFQHKMAEQARLHRMMTEVAPLAVEAVEEGNSDAYRKIFSEASAYPIPSLLNYSRKARAVLREVRKYSTSIERLQSIPISMERRLIFEQQIAGMPVLADSLWGYCDADPNVENEIHETLPGYSASLIKQIVEDFSRADREAARRRADILRLRYTLSSSVSLEYLVKRMTPACSMSIGSFLEWRGLQLCPVAGDIFRADIFLSGNSDDPSPGNSVEINGVPCDSKAGKRTYRHRFDTPGVHQLNVQGRVFDAWDSTLIQVCSRTFEVRVQPNRGLSTPKN